MGTLAYPVRLTKFAFLTLCALIVAAASAIPAGAAFPGANGKIVFSSNRNGNDEIYVMNADGSNRVDLTRNPASDATPEWSPSGTQIAFASNRSGEYEIYLMNPDGSGVTQLTSVGFNARPVFTSDGQYIVFTSTRDGNSEIYRMRLDGSEQTNLTNDPADDRLPASAPRGKMILFQSFRSGLARLYTMSENGGTAREVPGGPPQELDGNWSPSGNTLTFLGNSGGFDEFDIYTAHTDGSGLRQLTNTPNRIEFDPVWSPDGQQLVFEGCTGLGTDAQHCALYTMNADGTGETDISTPKAPYLDTFTGNLLDPFWTPSGDGTNVTMAQANGGLEFTLPPNTGPGGPNNWVNIGAFMACRFPSDFDIQVDYKLLSGPLPPNILQFFNTVEFTGGSFLGGTHGMFVFNPGFGDPGIGSNFLGADSFVPDTSLSGTMRMVRTVVAGTSTISAYRKVGTSWGLLGTSGAYTADEVAANLSVFVNTFPFPNTTVKVAYDNFRVNSGAISCPSWWTDNAHDWQPIPR